MRTRPDDVLINGYLETLNLRTAMARWVYRSVLRDFQPFMRTDSPDQAVSRTVVEAWLREKSKSWPEHMIVRRAQTLGSFLDWAVNREIISTNPLADLRQAYDQRSTAPIVRALLSPAPTAALEALRPLPRFASHLGSQLREYVSLMQTLGYRYKSHEYHFLRFDRFLQTRPHADAQPVTALIREWARLACTPYEEHQRLKMGRVMARALGRTDPSVVLPTIDRQLIRDAQRQQRRPYVYSTEEINRLLAAARAFPSPQTPLRPLTLHTMLILAYCAGLRLRELVHLTVADIHFEEGSIEVRDSKFFKSRRLPLPASVMGSLAHYLKVRRQVGAPCDPTTKFFWREQGRCGYTPAGAQRLLTQVIRRAQLKPSSGRVGPRLHDLRATFAVHRLTHWYREGRDIQSQLPYLSTFLGHKDIQGTLVYLTMTEELLQHASQRFHDYGALALTSSIGGKPCP